MDVEGIMNRTRKLRVLAATLILSFILTNTAWAEKVCVMEDTTIYATPNEEGKSYGILEAGTVLKLDATKGDWAKVSKGGKTGFVSSDDLSLIKVFDRQTVYLAEDASLYKNFSSDSAIEKLKTGDAVKLYAVAGDWAYIKAGTNKGIVETASLTVEKPETEDDDRSITAYAAIDGAKVYKSYSSSSKVIATLPVNTDVTVVAVKEGWCRVIRDGKTGYMKKATLSTEKVEVVVEKTFTAYANADGVKAYEKYTTTSAVLATLSLNDAVTVTAYADTWSRIVANGKIAYVKNSQLSTEKVEKPTPAPTEKSDSAPSDDGTSSVTPATGTAVEKDWWTSDIRTIFSVGTVVTITDVETGIAWQEKRLGGTNHADCQPVSAADTAAMKTACGSWSWQRRAIFVTINGINYAASMNCMPHGSDSIASNDFDGHHCIHFTNSRTHGTNSVCPLHQAAIEKAAAARL